MGVKKRNDGKVSLTKKIFGFFNKKKEEPEEVELDQNDTPGASIETEMKVKKISL